MGSIWSGGIGTRNWTGEQGPAAVVAAEEFTNNADLELLLQALRDKNGVLDGGAWLFYVRTV